MKRIILPLTSTLALLGTVMTLQAEPMFNNLGQPGDFRGFGPGLSAGTLFTTGTNRAQVNSLTVEHFLYDPANPPQGFQLRLYQAVFEPGNPTPTMTLVAEFGNPVVDPTATSTPGISTYVAYSPSSSVALEAGTTYAVTIGESADATGNPMLAFTDSADYSSSAGWTLGSDVFGVDLGGSVLWLAYSGHLVFKLDATPIVNQPPDLSNARASVATLWPPDGSMVPFHIEGVTDPDGDPVTITITAVYQDEVVAKPGPDALVNGSDTAAVRATRAGKGNGRVYQVFFTATDGKPDGTAEGIVQITVPHDEAHPVAIDDGPLHGYYDSTKP